MEFPAVPNLRLDDEYFEYQGCRYKYTDVVSIEFGAAITKHRVNFVPAGTSYDARLTIFPDTGNSFEIKPSKGWFGGLKEGAFKELQRVNAALSFIEPPQLNWSTAMFRKRRTENGKQATQARRDCLEVTTG